MHYTYKSEKLIAWHTILVFMLIIHRVIYAVTYKSVKLIAYIKS